MKIGQYAKEYLDQLKNSLDKINLEILDKIVEEINKAYMNDKHIFIMGNGGSAATASHFACDLGKGSLIEGKKRFRVMSLTDNVPLMTAWANDASYNHIFREQLANFCGKDDVVIAFSGSGNSPNVLEAIVYANQIQAITIGFTGFQGGKLKDLAKYALVFPSDNMERIEDGHLILEHIIHLFLLKNNQEK